MSGVAIYMEGGGRGPDTRAALRRGMDVLLGSLKQAATPSQAQVDALEAGVLRSAG